MAQIDGGDVIIRDDRFDGCIAEEHFRNHPHDNTAMIACMCPRCTPRV